MDKEKMKEDLQQQLDAGHIDQTEYDDQLADIENLSDDFPDEGSDRQSMLEERYDHPDSARLREEGR